MHTWRDRPITRILQDPNQMHIHKYLPCVNYSEGFLGSLIEGKSLNILNLYLQYEQAFYKTIH